MGLLTKMSKFGLIGISITALNFVIYSYMIAHGYHYLLATSLGWVIGVSVSFIANKYYTFLNRSAVDLQQIRRFLACYLGQLALGSTTIFLMIDVIRIDYTVAYFINVAITSCFSFFFMDKLVFVDSSAAPVSTGRLA